MEAPKQPQASRPHMPGYGILAADQGRGLLPWSWATERLAGAHGRPHVMPVWGLWLDNTFYFSTGRESRKARNLVGNPHCVVCPERADEAVLVEGEAQEVREEAVPGRFVAEYDAKYQWKMDPSQDPIYAVRPRVAFGMIETGGQFCGSATRWCFGPGASKDET